MYRIALTMLFGDKGKYLGIVTGIALASLIMIQQPGILISMLSHTYSFISDITLPDIWVMDPKVQFIDDARPLLDTQLYRVRSVQGIDWAVPLYKGGQRVRLANGELVNCNLLGFDDATLIGGPGEMIQGKLEDLRIPDSVIVDESGARNRLARQPQKPGESAVALKVGDVLEINDKRAMVVGIARGTPTFQAQPILYTTYNRAKTFALSERKMLTYILAKSKAGEDPNLVARRITEETGLAAYTAEAFKQKSLNFFMQHTPVLTNFGFVVLVGFVVGAAVTGQIFYNFTLDNLRHFAVFKAMGATDAMLLRMILLQALLVGFVGFGIGAGLSAAFALSTSRGTDLAMTINWQLLLGSGLAVGLIVLLAALVSARKVLVLEPAMVFKS